MQKARRPPQSYGETFFDAPLEPARRLERGPKIRTVTAASAKYVASPGQKATRLGAKRNIAPPRATKSIEKARDATSCLRPTFDHCGVYRRTFDLPIVGSVARTRTGTPIRIAGMEVISQYTVNPSMYCGGKGKSQTRRAPAIRFPSVRKQMVAATKADQEPYLFTNVENSSIATKLAGAPTVIARRESSHPAGQEI